MVHQLVCPDSLVRARANSHINLAGVRNQIPSMEMKRSRESLLLWWWNFQKVKRPTTCISLGSPPRLRMVLKAEEPNVEDGFPKFG